MALNRSVLMPDGTVRARHEVVSITHVAGAVTHIDVVSADANGAGAYRSAVTVECDDTVTFERAYEIVAADERFVEYVDPSAAALAEVLPLLTDEQAEQVPGAFPEWEPGRDYEAGERVRFGEMLYRIVQGHTSQEGWEPDAAPALFARVGEPDVVAEWVQPTGAQDAYATGDRVYYDGKVWVSTADANVWAPGVYGWEEE